MFFGTENFGRKFCPVIIGTIFFVTKTIRQGAICKGSSKQYYNILNRDKQDYSLHLDGHDQGHKNELYTLTLSPMRYTYTRIRAQEH